MKKSLYFFSFAALASAFAVSACSHDSDNNNDVCTQSSIPEGKVECTCVNGVWTECKDKDNNIAACTDSMPEGKINCKCENGEWTACEDVDSSCPDAMPDDKINCKCVNGEWTACEDIDSSCPNAMPEGKINCKCENGEWTDCEDIDSSCQDAVPEGKINCKCENGEWTDCEDIDSSCQDAVPEGKICKCENGEWTDCEDIDSSCQDAVPEGKICKCVNGEWTDCEDMRCSGDKCNHRQNPAAEKVKIESRTGCVLDSDCATGSFCFQSQCVIQCRSDKAFKPNCQRGYYCDTTRGRCVTKDYLLSMKSVEEQIASAGNTISEDDKVLMRSNAELNADTMSNVRKSVLGQVDASGQVVEKITFSSRMPQTVFVDRNKKTQTVSFSTKKSIGDVQYVINMPGVDLPVLKTSKGVKNSVGEYTYSFEIETDQIPKVQRLNRLRSGGVITTPAESADVVSNAGTFSVVLAQRVKADGIYEGYVTPLSVLSGINLPIRMGISANPNEIGTFSEISKISLILPVSNTDIFSPENVAESGKETWARLEMSKKKLSECACGKPCWAADFSTNDYSPSGSVLFDASQRVNRNIRVELFDFDAATQTFTGRIIDGLKGLYRENAIDGEQISSTWNDTEVQADFSVSLTNSIDDSISIHPHQSANESIRELSDSPAQICDDLQIALLMSRIDLLVDENDVLIENCNSIIDNEEKKQECIDIEVCKNVKSMDDFNNLSSGDGRDYKLFCLQKATQSIVSDEGSMSNVLGAVLKADASSQESSDPVAVVCNGKTEIYNFDDFQKACADTTCSLCEDHPEYVCAADLIARRYLQNDLDIEKQTDLMVSWISIIRESYLPFQYMAWNDDNTIRKSWLTGAVYSGTFAASVMGDFNDRLLKDYREKVLDVHHSIMGRQFSQTTLEMLSQSFVHSSPKTIELNSARNTILSELSNTWGAVASALGLGTRRYDVLLQNDAKRIQTASELRPYLFDLYFAGVLESAINLKADQGSLNASYGANLGSIISKLKSLDQTFEDLVFMRDGEIVTDTSLDTGSGLTALGIAQTRARNAVDKATKKRKTVFDEISAKRKEKLTVQDSYLSSLASMRAEIVNLCGYPSDCTPDKQSNCKLFTAPYFCGFALDSTSTKGVNLETFSSDNSISQVTKYDECVKSLKANSSKNESEIFIACAGGNLALDSDPVSTTGGTTVSEAGLAIQAYRQAELEYQTAVSEYDIMAQRVRNNYATLDAWAKNISDWYAARSAELKKLDNNLEKIKSYEDALKNYDIKVNDKEVAEALAEYDANQDVFKQWSQMTYDNMAIQESMNGLITGASIANVFLGGLQSLFSMKMHLAELNALTNDELGLFSAKNAALNVAVAKMGVSSAAMLTLSTSATSISQIGQVAYGYKMAKLDRKSEVSLKELQKKFAETISNIKLSAEGLDSKYDEGDIPRVIADMERTNELLLAQAENEDQRNRDRQEMEIKRNEFVNFALGLIPLAHTVRIKELAKYRALVKYLTVVQRAELVASQYDAKLGRYQLMSNAMFSASEFFQSASDLESVESFIEFARNDLSNYLAAIEYLTVRPFVELRRSIYTARGTNDLEMLYEQLNDLTKKCGSGAETTNKMILSLKEQLGILNVKMDGISPDDRFHLELAKGNLPVSAQTRYTVTGTVADELKTGSFYSASFNIGTQIANIDTSCNAKIDQIKVRFISKKGQKIRDDDTLAPSVSLFYGGQTQLLSCHRNIDAITASIGSRSTYGKFSTFAAKPFADGINVGIYEIPSGKSYKFTDTTELSNVTEYEGLKGYPLMATYSIVFDPTKGNNSKIHWENVADIEIQINYTTGSLGQDSRKCQYDIQ